MRNKRRRNNVDEELEARNGPMRLVDEAPWATRHICIEGMIAEKRAGAGERGSTAKASAQLATSSLMKAVAAIQ